MTETIINSPARTDADNEIKRTIAPAMIELAKDCNELEDKLNQVLAVNEALQKVIRDTATASPYQNWVGGPL